VKLGVGMKNDSNNKNEIVKIQRLPIELNKLLKIRNIAESGGEANVIIEQGLVKVNGVVDLHKSKKINAGDVVEIKGMKIIIR